MRRSASIATTSSSSSARIAVADTFGAEDLDGIADRLVHRPLHRRARRCADPAPRALERFGEKRRGESRFIAAETDPDDAVAFAMARRFDGFHGGFGTKVARDVADQRDVDRIAASAPRIARTHASSSIEG